MKANIMEQELFEKKLSEYVNKVVDPDTGISKYVIKQHPRIQIIDVPSGLRICKTGKPHRKRKVDELGRPARRIHTPNGTYTTAIAAAQALGITGPTVYNRVNSKMEKFKEWYYEES